MISVGARSFAKFAMRATPKHTIRALCGGGSSAKTVGSKLATANASRTLGTGFPVRSVPSLLSSIPPLPKHNLPSTATATAAVAAIEQCSQSRSLSTSPGNSGNSPGTRELVPGSVVDAGDELDAILHDSRGIPVIVDFHANWCGPCRVLAPVLKKAVEENKKAILVKVDVDHAPETASLYEVASLPTVVAFRNGVLYDSFVGSRDPTFIKKFVEKVTEDV